MQWSVPSSEQGSFAAQPMSGILQGNEKHTVSWVFAPSDRATYNFTASCSYGSVPPGLAMQLASRQSPASPGQDPTALTTADMTDALVKVFSEQNLTETLPVNLVGQGTVGALTLQPTSIDFGPLAVGYPVKRSITLLNQSGGNLRYSITCRQVINSNSSAAVVQQAASALLGGEAQYALDADSQGALSSTEQRHSLADVATSANADSAQHVGIEEPHGILAARATKTLVLTLTPQRRHQYNLELVCETATANALDSAATTTEGTAAVPASLCAPPVTASVQGFSTYPTLMITDIVCQGWEKPFAWQQMACSQINTDLASELNQVSCCALLYGAMRCCVLLFCVMLC